MITSFYNLFKERCRPIRPETMRDPEENKNLQAREKDNFKNELVAQNSKYYIGFMEQRSKTDHTVQGTFSQHKFPLKIAHLDVNIVSDIFSVNSDMGLICVLLPGSPRKEEEKIEGIIWIIQLKAIWL